jgi:hypothetical protein
VTVEDIIPQRDWPTLAEANKRLARLNDLDADRMAEALAFLSGFRPAVFDATLAATEPCTADDHPDPADDPEPYCTDCGSNVGIFLGGGTDWRHFRGEGTRESPADPHDTDHAPIIAWRPASAVCD